MRKMIAYSRGAMIFAHDLGKMVVEDGFRVGALRLVGRAFLAPMAGVTDSAMRRIAERYGASATISEMIAADGVTRDDRETGARLHGIADVTRSAPRAIQIAARDVDGVVAAVRRGEAAGADWIDLNMGCPCKRVTGGLAGAALMRDLDQATRLIAAARAAATVPVTVKMRLGWDDSSRNAPELARRAEGEGVALIAVHGRTRQQFYTGRADWSAIAAVRAAVSIPVVANGDCASEADAMEMLRLSGADAVMVGRAAQGRPWLVGDIAFFLATGRRRPPPALRERGAVAREHLEGLLSLMGVEAGLRHARKHLASYVDHAFGVASPGVADMRRRLVTTGASGEAFRLIEEIFLDPQERAVA
jgi:tRNA-dihydrouridine synthase B